LKSIRNNLRSRRVALLTLAMKWSMDISLRRMTNTIEFGLTKSTLGGKFLLLLFSLPTLDPFIMIESKMDEKVGLKTESLTTERNQLKLVADIKLAQRKSLSGN
jgi:hypothetical protein